MRSSSPIRHALPAAHLALFCCALGLAGPLAAEPAPPSVHDIVQKAIVRDDARRDRRVLFEADQTIRTDRLNTAGKVVSSKTEKMIAHPTKEISFSANTTASSPGSNEESVKAQHIMAVMNLGRLAPHFTQTLVGSAIIQGRDCYVVSYRPKPGQSADTREEKVVNNVAGRFWIAKDNFDILQSEGSLVGPVTVALIASVTRMDFKFRSQPMPNGDVGPAEISVDMAYHAPFYDFRQLQVNTLTNWRLRSGH